MDRMDKISSTLCIIASSLLLVMAIFHLSGIEYVNSLVQSVEISDLIKDIFPVLFILPSVQLLGLASFGLISISLGNKAKLTLMLISIFIALDAILAFVIGALIPGFVLLTPAIIFTMVSFRIGKMIKQT